MVNFCEDCRHDLGGLEEVQECVRCGRKKSDIAKTNGEDSD